MRPLTARRLFRLSLLACWVGLLVAPLWAQTPEVTVRLGWEAPTQNTDGTPLTDLQEYVIYAGAALDTLGAVARVTQPATTHTMTIARQPLTYFTVSAMDTAGNESAQSAPAVFALDVVSPGSPGVLTCDGTYTIRPGMVVTIQCQGVP